MAMSPYMRGLRGVWGCGRLLGALASAIACGDQQPKASSGTSVPTAPVVSPVGYGLIRIGETAHELALSGDSAAASNPGHLSCRYVRPSSFPPGVKAMIVDNVIVRIDIDSPGIPTIEGAQVGDPESHVLELYNGHVASLPNKYLKDGHNLVVWQPSTVTSRMIFETDGRTVLRYRVGRQPAVDLVEGCG
jgi:hypothetical protein